MKDQKELEQLRAEYIEVKMATMKDDGDGTEMIFYAERGLEEECKDLTFEELESLMMELAEWNGDNEEEEYE
jgi:hypothetical protein